MNKPMLSIIIPTYNEQHGIAHTIAEIGHALQPEIDFEIVIVDDSNDQTPAILQSLSEQDERIRFHHRQGQRGLATAVVLGFSLARGGILAVMDADLQHPPALLPVMFRAIQAGADIAIPSRYVHGSCMKGFSLPRRIASLGAKWAGKLLLPSLRRASDPTGGFLMLRRSVIEGVRLRPIGWRVQIEVLAMGHYQRVVEIPYTFQARYADDSKMNYQDTLKYFLHLFLLMVRSERERRFYLFALVGLSGVGVDMLLFQLLTTSWHIHENLAATLSALGAAISNLLLNRFITWRGIRRRGTIPALHEFARLAAVYCLGIGVKNLLVWGLSAADLTPWLANLSGIAACGITNYLLCDRWVFPRPRPVQYLVWHDASGR